MHVLHRRHLGGKLGEEVQNRFGIDKIGQLTSVKRKKLETAFGDKTGYFLCVCFFFVA